ncbi:MAG: hypothetical protein P8Y76_11950 [bacterium]
MNQVLIVCAALLLAGCRLGEVNTPPSASAPKSVTAPAAPKGWRQTGTMNVDGQAVPVYSEIYRGEGQSPYQMALNPATGKIQAFTYDDVGNIIWTLDPMEPSGE